MVEAVEPVERHPRAIAIAALIFAALSTICAWSGDGFLEADAATHYLYARRAFQDTYLFFDVWGRPVCTGIYAIPAALGGLHGVRFMSLLLALGTAELVRRIAVGQGLRWPALAFIFTLAQPLVFLHSFSELTELPFAFLLAGAFLAYQRRQFLVMSILVGLLPAARPEGFGFILLGALALLAHRRLYWLPLLMLPLCAWSYFGWRKWGFPLYDNITIGHIAIGRHLPDRLHWLLWLKANWPYSPQSAYTPGTIWRFVGLLPTVTGPLIFPAVLVAIGVGTALLTGPALRHWQFHFRTPKNLRDVATVILSAAKDLVSGTRRFFAALRMTLKNRDWQSWWSKEALAHRRRCDALILVLPLGVLAVHSYLYYRGKMASSGEVRYMLAVAPMWALLACAGWQWIFRRLPLRWPFAIALVAALLPAVVNIWWRVIPLRNSPDWHAAMRLAEWHRTSELRPMYPRLLAPHPAVALGMADQSPPAHPESISREIVAKCPPGSILLWDPVYCGFNADQKAVVMPQDLAAAGWVLLSDWGMPHEKDWYIYLSPTSADGKATPSFEVRDGLLRIPRPGPDGDESMRLTWRQWPSTASTQPAALPSR